MFSNWATVFLFSKYGTVYFYSVIHFAYWFFAPQSTLPAIDEFVASMTDIDPVNSLNAKEAKDRLGTIFYSMVPESLLIKPDHQMVSCFNNNRLRIMIARRLREDLPTYSTTDLHWWTARNDDVGADDIRNVYQALCSSLNQIRKLDLFDQLQAVGLFAFQSSQCFLVSKDRKFGCDPSCANSVHWVAIWRLEGIVSW